MWFETLTGFPEESPQQVRENITVDGNVLKSHPNGKVFVCGQFSSGSPNPHVRHFVNQRAQAP